jgi:hypothetical protein
MPLRALALLTLILAALAVLPAAAEPGADPRDQEIAELKRRLEEQARQIRELQEAVRALQGAPAPPPAGPAPEVPGPEPPPALPSPAEESSPEVPGPEPPPPLPPSTQTPATGTGQQPQLNPNISVIGLFDYQAGGAPGDPLANGARVDEIELALQAPIDPFASLDVFVSFPHKETPELEEARLTWLNLPGGLQARAGMLLADFGRINPLHTHELPQIDRPLPLREILGQESLRDPGAELSWLAPLPWYSKASLQVLSRSVGHHHEEGEEEPFQLFPSGGSKSPLFVARWDNLFDLDENTTLNLGLSGARSTIGSDELTRSRLAGADLTLKWKPLDREWISLTWQSEVLLGDRLLPAPQPQSPQDPPGEPFRQSFRGWYSFLNYQFDRNFRAGVCYGTVTMPGDLRQHEYTGLLEWIPSEWNSLRFQYSRNSSNFQSPYNLFLFQWNVVVGPHGAHKY